MKLRAEGVSGKYNHLTVKEVRKFLSENQVPGRSKLRRRYTIIEYLEEAERLRKRTNK